MQCYAYVLNVLDNWLIFALAFPKNIYYIDCMSKQHTTSEHSEEQQETRTRIIAAAYKVLAEKGYDATTLREISREAEAAPGLVHYYFGGKDQLLVEVLKTMSDRYTEATRELSRRVAPDQFMEAALAQPFERISKEPEWYRLRYELFALGLHNPLLTPGVRDLLAEGRNSIGKAVSLVQQSSSITASVDPRVLASLLLAVFDGLALQKIMDPEVDLDAAYQLLVQLIRSLPSGKE
jgi:AcrR family transcriptional regulator